MPFNGFQLDSRSYNEGFVCSTDVWREKKQDRIRLAACTYDQTHYSPSDFTRYNVRNHLPPHVNRRRQMEFLAGRCAAKSALTSLDEQYANSVQVHVGQNNAPIWPASVVGSISHCGDIAVSATAYSKCVAHLGIDIEFIVDDPTVKVLSRHAFTPKELSVMLSLGFADSLAATAIFSAKESIFKALFPKTQRVFGFEKAKLVAACLSAQQLRFNVNRSFARVYHLPNELMVSYKVLDDTVLTLASPN